MDEKKKVLDEMEAAIDAMDMEQVEKSLSALSKINPSISGEDPALFSRRIRNSYKEKENMRKPSRTARIAVAVAAVLVMGVTAYASGIWKVFTFTKDNQYTTVRTTENMTRQEAEAFVQEGQAPPSTVEPQNTMQADTQEYQFDTVQEAEKGLDMKIVMPAKMPALELSDISGQKLQFGETASIRTVWVNYGSEEVGKMLGITVSRETVTPGSAFSGYSQSFVDSDSFGTYKSKSGVTFTTMTESDDTGTKTAHIAAVVTVEYEYGLVFFGFQEKEIQQILDSVDISSMK